MREHLVKLGLLDNKSGGVPQAYRAPTAPMQVRRQVLAGLIDSDGWLNKRGLYYELSQPGDEHRLIIEHAKALAHSCGIATSDISTAPAKDGSRRPIPSRWEYRLRIKKGSERLQDFIKVPRKLLKNQKQRVRLHDTDSRHLLRLEDFDGEFVPIKVSGNFFQLGIGSLR